MTDITGTRPEERHLAVVRLLLTLAGAAALVAAGAGVTLLIASPESGSRLEGVLGFTAAVSGLAIAALAAGAAAYAQIKDLWRHAPVWARTATWTVLGVALLVSLLRSSM